MYDEAVINAVETHGSESPSAISKDIRSRFGVHVPPTTVLKIRNEQKRAENVAESKTKASETLHEKLDLADEIIKFYVGIIRDDTVKASERLTAARDLRGYIQLTIKAAGDEHIAKDKMFEISPDWDLGFDGPVNEQVN